MSTVKSLFGTTPAEIFESGLENLDGIEAVALSVLWRDSTITTGWSNAEAGKLALMIMALDEKLRRETFPAPDAEGEG